MGHTFLVIVDAYSKWNETHIVSSTSTEATIAVLRTVFALPDTVVSDNGSGFTSSDFLASNGIRHTRTSPYHPSSNGLAERAVLSKDLQRGKVQYKKDYPGSDSLTDRPAQEGHHQNCSWVGDCSHS